MKDKETLLDELVNDYAMEVDCYIGDLRKLMQSPIFGSDDMKELATVAFQLSEYAQECADEFESIAERRR